MARRNIGFTVCVPIGGSRRGCEIWQIVPPLPAPAPDIYLLLLQGAYVLYFEARLSVYFGCVGGCARFSQWQRMK